MNKPSESDKPEAKPTRLEEARRIIEEYVMTFARSSGSSVRR